MRRLAIRLTIGGLLVGVLAAGLSGAYSYGRDYNLHRGFAVLAKLPRAGTGRLLTVQFYSAALHRRADYMVYLPPGYRADRRYPTYYLLHGMPGQPKVFVDIANMDVRLDNQMSLRRARPMILVYPDGRIGGSVFSDSEWANTRAGAYESYVSEVMHNVDHRFATLARRQDRVIAGFSAGAYGAMNIALHHLREFGAVQSWSGYFLQTPTGVFAGAGRATLQHNSPLQYAPRLRPALARYPLRVEMFVGRDDSSSVQQGPMVRVLRAAGAHVRAQLVAGGHDWSVWYPRLNAMLDLASWMTLHPARTAHPGAAPGPAAAPAVPAPVPAAIPAPRLTHRHARSELRLLGALLLALLSAALINLGFVLQQRGHTRARRSGRSRLRDAFRDRLWLSGQAIGWIGFAGQIVAIALAPLTLVQAFSAGSLALSVPIAARLFGHRVRRDQFAAIALIAVCLASLPVGFAAQHHHHLQSGVLIGAALAALLAAVLLLPRAGTASRAIAAGVLYGVADAAIKADAVSLRMHGLGGVLSGWSLLAAMGTFGGFLALQMALREGDPVRPLSLMNAFTAVAAAGLGIAAFGEGLGSGTVSTIGHGVAIAVVLAAVRPLVREQQRLADADGGVPAATAAELPARAVHSGGQRTAPTVELVPLAHRAARPVRAAAAALAGAVAILVVAVVATGLLYRARELHWLAVGPPVPDALPLLQLAGFAGQPLAAVALTAMVAGALLGVAFGRLPRARRLMLLAILAPFAMLVASDASYALARNLPFAQVLVDRAPGLGPWMEGLLLAVGACLPPRRVGIVPWVDRLRVGRARRPLVVRARRAAAPVMLAALAAGVAASLLAPNDHARAQQRAPQPALPAGSASSRTVAARLPGRPAVRPASRRVAGGRLLTVNFYSPALRRRADYLVYLPAGYSPARRLPVFYMLHGMPGRPRAFTVSAGIERKLERLIRRRLVQPMILVFPDGRIGGRTQTDSEWANTRAGRFESYVVDVVHNVDHRFATLPFRGDRAIAGLSAGAYGAANVGLHRVALFGLIQVWSGYFTQTPAGVFAHAGNAALAYNSPIDYVWRMRRVLARYPLRIFLYVGRGDGDRAQTPPMAAALRAMGADASYAIYHGGHSWDLWAPHADQMLIMASRYFAAAPPAPLRRGLRPAELRHRRHPHGARHRP